MVAIVTNYFVKYNVVALKELEIMFNDLIIGNKSNEYCKLNVILAFH